MIPTFNEFFNVLSADFQFPKERIFETDQIDIKIFPSGVGTKPDADPNVFGGFRFRFTMSRAHLFPGLVIIASTGDPEVTLQGTLGIGDSVCLSTVIVTGIILDPLPQIPMDVIKPKSIG